MPSDLTLIPTLLILKILVEQHDVSIDIVSIKDVNYDSKKSKQKIFPGSKKFSIMSLSFMSVSKCWDANTPNQTVFSRCLPSGMSGRKF